MEEKNCQIQIFSGLLVGRLAGILISILEYMPDADLRRIMNMLFLLQQDFVRRNCQPAVALDFEAWEMGPVQKDLYADMAGSMWVTGRFLERYATPDGYRYKPKFKVDARAFRATELDDIRGFLQKARWMTEAELDVRVRGKDSLWHRCAEQGGVLSALEDGIAVTTGVKVDFALLFDDEDDRSEYRINAEAERGTEMNDIVFNHQEIK